MVGNLLGRSFLGGGDENIFSWFRGDSLSFPISPVGKTLRFLSEFISSNTETFRKILLHKTLFTRVHIKQYWHFWRVNTKQYYTHFSEFISHNIFLASHYKITLHVFSELYRTILKPPELLPNSTVKIILFKFLSNKTDIFRELLPNTSDCFHRRSTRQYFFLSQMWTLNLYWLG